MIFLVNSLSLFAIYYCFKAAHSYHSLSHKIQNNITSYFVITWMLILLTITFLKNDFALIKAHAGIVLVYSLVIHLISHYKKTEGSAYIASGIIISFFSIVVHSLRFSLSEWLNYKDIAHLIMLLSLTIIYKGVSIKLQNNFIKNPQLNSATQ